ncbi:MFS general substrate transporter [Mycena floridula]|nr:MFS general substrate transporter [Mycena floridula]
MSIVTFVYDDQEMFVVTLAEDGPTFGSKDSKSEDNSSLKPTNGLWLTESKVALVDDNATIYSKESSQVDNVSLNERSSSPSQSAKQITLERIQFLILCGSILGTGWNDGTNGVLLPRIQQEYNIGYTTVSLLFVFATIGFVLGALLNIPCSDRFTFGQLMVLGASLQVISYAMDAAAPPFPVLCFSYALNGIGMAIQDGNANGYVAAIKRKPEKKMSLLHAAYSAGALLSPLSASQFAQMTRWSFHYLVSLGIVLVNIVLLLVVFRLKSTDACLSQIGQGEEATKKQKQNDSSSLKQILSLKSVYILSLYVLVYIGFEATIDSWIVTYMIRVRDGGPSMGYTSTGFFGGIMLGRILLLKVNEKIGERRVVYFYFFIALGLEFILWFVPSIVGDAVAVGLLGFVIGPWYPIAMNHAARIIPPWLLAPCMGWLAGFGQAGSALFPFITGVVFEKVGIQSFPPILIGMMITAIAIWTVVLKSSSPL